MAKDPKTPTTNAHIFGSKGVLSPWLSSVKAVTGVDPREQIVPGTIYLLLDTSGSMAGPPIAEAVEGARRFDAECAASGQLLGLVSFSTSATIRAKPSFLGIARALSDIQCGGSTNMAAAVDLATADLNHVSGRRTVVIATDGHPDDCMATIVAAERAKHSGIRVMTIGTVGADAAFLALIASSAEFTSAASPGKLGLAIAASAKLLLK